jgi:hypothetical protein
MVHAISAAKTARHAGVGRNRDAAPGACRHLRNTNGGARLSAAAGLFVPTGFPRSANMVAN